MVNNFMNYRSIWKKHYGEIPRDEDGLSYEIHHIDGDRNNNNIENLKCLSVQEHFDLHYKQGDWFACKLILQKLNIPKEQRSDIIKKAGEKISIIMTGRKYSHNDYSERNRKISEALTGKKRPDQSARMKGTTRPDISKALLGRKLSKENINKRKITLSLQPVRQCPYCNKYGKGSSMTRYHFNNCKYFT